MIEGTFWYELWKYTAFLITGLCVLAFVLTPFNMIYRSKRYRGELDPKKSFLENFFSIP